MTVSQQSDTLFTRLASTI